MLDDDQLEYYREKFAEQNQDACCWDDDQLNYFISYVYSRGFREGEVETEYRMRDPDQRG